MVDEDALGPDSQSSPPRRRFLTLSERRRQELEAAGAQSYIEWYQNKQDAAAKERHYLQVKLLSVDHNAAVSVYCLREACQESNAQDTC